jgi:hypothetical protein
MKLLHIILALLFVSVIMMIADSDSFTERKELSDKEMKEGFYGYPYYGYYRYGYPYYGYYPWYYPTWW